jgi:Ca-activated chloride channel family protein
MNQNKISPDDPRLTAYALNEMEPAERAEFEQSLNQDAAARQAVAEIRTAAAALTNALEQEPGLAGDVHVQPGATEEKRQTKRDPYAKIVRFPYWTISSLAAACFAVFFIYWQRHQLPSDQKNYIEVPLAAPAEGKNEPTAKKSAGADLAKAAQVELRQKERKDVTVAFPAMEPAAAGSLVADSVASHPAVRSLDEENQPVKLAPFEVTAKADIGFDARDTLAGARVRTQLSGMASGAPVGNEKQSDRTWGLARAGRESNTEAYSFRKDSDYMRVTDNPLSTFSVDVDTASYANVRRFLTQGQRPPVDAVRIEELVNYFPYNYAGPEVAMRRVPSADDRNSRVSAVAQVMTDKDGTPLAVNEAPPFAAHLEVAGAPWAPAHRLVRVGLKGRELSDAARPVANLVFLLDVSGSMNEPNKLPLVKQSLRLLVEKLRPDDRVAIAIYAGASGLALPSTPVAHKADILDAIDRLQAEGSTNGAMGIQLAYDIAKANFISGGVNRVILATDGDFNVGVTSEGELVRLIEEKAKSGVFLTVLGYGMGNFKDATLEKLADKGNGNYAYIDTLAEAKKMLVEQAGGTLVTIAKDVKIQVEFNPAMVQAYRLIGYENRLLAKEDFNNDQVDAGEIGAGHTVTALYEVVPVGAEMPGETGPVDALKYQVPENPKSKVQSPKSAELLTVKIRYKEPAGEVSSKLEFPLHDSGARFVDASPDFKFAAAVAAFGMVLRDSPHKGTSTLDEVVKWARAGLGSDPGGYRNEFIGLVERAVQVVQ